MQVLDDFAKSDLDKLERLADNFEWVHKQYDNLKEKYDNQYVAIKDRRIVDKDIDHDRLVKRRNITNYDESIAIEYILCYKRVNWSHSCHLTLIFVIGGITNKNGFQET